MSVLSEFLSEIESLKQYKKLYEIQQKEKQRMSDLLYDLMIEKYENTPYEQRVEFYKNDTCSACRYLYDCKLVLEEDILKPIKSDDGWIPGKRACGSFEWS